MKVSLTKRALDFAAMAHDGQFRKYPKSKIPYMSHVAGVGMILSRHGFAEEIVVAGILHDTLEDCPEVASFEKLTDIFGLRVANLVLDCSEKDKSLSWQERKDAYMESLDHKSWDSVAIAIADKIDNFESIVVCAVHHGNPWPTFKFGKAEQLNLFDKMGSKLKAIVHPLVDEYFETLEKVRNVDDTEPTVRNSSDCQVI